jgi:hypothetical protein
MTKTHTPSDLLPNTAIILSPSESLSCHKGCEVASPEGGERMRGWRGCFERVTTKTHTPSDLFPNTAIILSPSLMPPRPRNGLPIGHE